MSILVIFRRYPLTLLCIVLVLYLSFFRPPSLGDNEVEGLDKVAHILMYGGMCGVLWYEYARSHARLKPRAVALWAVCAPMALSGVVELLQEALTSYRGGEWADFAANSLGVLSAAAVGYFFIWPRFKMGK